MTANQLRKKFDRDLKKLQKNCKHTRKSNWMEYHWGPGRFSGYSVKVCRVCDKTIDEMDGRPEDIAIERDTKIDSIIENKLKK